MDKIEILYSFVLLIGVFISAISQVILKKAAQKQYDVWWKEYLNPRVIIAYVVFFAATFCSIFAYKVVPLSTGPILEATSYIYITFFGIRIFKEKINKRKIIALLVIISGIVVFSLS